MYCEYCGKEIDKNEQFCGYCGKKVRTKKKQESIDREDEKIQEESPVEESAPPLIFQSFQEEKKEKENKIKNRVKIILPTAFGIALIVFIVLKFFIFKNPMMNYVELVQKGSPNLYPNTTYGEAYTFFFDQPKWKHIHSKEAEIVEFEGNAFYQGKSTPIRIRFVLNVEKESFRPTEVYVDGKLQDIWNMTDFVLTPFAKYENENSNQVENKPTNFNTEDGKNIYVCKRGPKSYIIINKIDEEGIEFWYCFGSSKVKESIYSLYCSANFVGNNREAILRQDYYQMVMTLEDNGEIYVEAQGQHPGGLDMSGAYVREDEYYYGTQGEFVFPLSDYALIQGSDLEGMTALECKIARNEILARHGRLFKDKILQRYFNHCSWYHGRIEPDEFPEDILSEVEWKNMETILTFEKQNGYQ